MFKHHRFRHIAIPAITAAVIAVSGAAHAGTADPAQQPQPEKPIDCKKNPDHERCKGKGY